MNYAELLKIKLMTKGIRITDEAKLKLTQNNKVPLSIFMYPTTSGIKLKISGTNIYVNAPFKGKCYEQSNLVLDYIGKEFTINENNNNTPVDPIPLNNNILEKNKNGIPFTDLASTQLDRVRISPIDGCAFSCKFCNQNNWEYKLYDSEELIEAARKAIRESPTPIKHMLISGGTPKISDYEYFDNTVQEITKAFDMPIDVMMSPRKDLNCLQKLKSFGVSGLSINLELFDENIANKLAPQKSITIGKTLYFEFLKEAVKIFGEGNVRSILIVGLEPIESTLKGIEELAKIKVVPVLSPFIASDDTLLKDHPTPDIETLIKAWEESKKIVKKYEMNLGPRCIPCQHNTLTFPDKSDFYHYS